MIFSLMLNCLTLMCSLLAGYQLQLCEQKENLQVNEYLGFPENVKKKQTEKWEDSKVKLLRSGAKSPVALNGKRAIYELTHGSRKKTIPVVVFSDSKSGLIWAGPEQDGYLEFKADILGFRINASRIIWCESLLKHDPQAAAPDVTTRFGQDISGISLLHSAISPAQILVKEKSTNLRSHIKNPWMFTNGRLSSQGATPIVTKIQWDEDLLKLDLTDQTKEFEATVWIDLKAREIKKVEEKPWTFFGDIFKKTINQ